MNFSFNFFNDDSSDEAEGSDGKDVVFATGNSSGSIAAEGIVASPLLLDGPRFKQHLFDRQDLMSYVSGLHHSTITINYRNGSLPIKVLSSHQSRIDRTSDIIRGIYEGGYKVWECSLDLAQFLLHDTLNNILPPSSSSSVIELGCGQGVPGMVALKLGYRSVVFSDLNEQVIIEATMPNIYLNFFIEGYCSNAALGDVQFFSGDWKDLNTHFFSHDTG